MTAVDYFVAWLPKVEFAGVCRSLGEQTSVSMISKNNLSEIHTSQRLDWTSQSLSPYFFLILVKRPFLELASNFLDHKHRLLLL